MLQNRNIVMTVAEWHRHLFSLKSQMKLFSVCLVFNRHSIRIM